MVAEALADLKAGRAPTPRRAFLDQIEAARNATLVKRRIAKRRAIHRKDAPGLVIKDLERTARHLRRSRIVAGQRIVPALAGGVDGRRVDHESLADFLAWMADQIRAGVVWRSPAIERMVAK
jgi:hypothetical protein